MKRPECATYTVLTSGGQSSLEDSQGSGEPLSSLIINIYKYEISFMFLKQFLIEFRK